MTIKIKIDFLKNKTKCKIYSNKGQNFYYTSSRKSYIQGLKISNYSSFCHFRVVRTQMYDNTTYTPTAGILPHL